MLKKILLGLAFVATLFVGVAIGTSGSAQPTATPAPAKTVQVPGPTVKQPVPGPTVTKEVETRVAGTPAICVTALEKGDEVINIAAQGFMIVSDVLTAASNFDVSGMEAGTQKLNELQPSLVSARSAYDSASSSCRAQQ